MLRYASQPYRIRTNAHAHGSRQQNRNHSKIGYGFKALEGSTH